MEHVTNHIFPPLAGIVNEYVNPQVLVIMSISFGYNDHWDTMEYSIVIDPKIAEQQVLQKALSLDPNVTQYIRFPPTNGDTQAKGLINQMNSARKAVAQEKKAPDTQKAGAPESPPKQPNQRFPARPLAALPNKRPQQRHLNRHPLALCRFNENRLFRHTDPP